jgi:hypothetical protein
MLTNYPTFFNNIAIIRPEKWDEEYEVLETVNETEAGTDVVDVRRKGKLTITVSYKCSSIWAKKFEQFFDEDTLSVKFYDAKADDYITKTMRMRNFKKSLVKHSEGVRYGNGVHKISFDLIEF